MTPAPSGRQTVLAGHGQEVVLVEMGGGIRTYRAGGVEVLDGYGPGERCSSGRGQPLLPWPNRLDGGSYDFGGVHEQAPLTEVAAGNAIHGLTRWSPWSVFDAGTDHATLGFTLRPQPGWAWTLDLFLTYRLRPEGLRVTVGAVNRSATPCPFGAGFHPYLRAPTGRVDDLVVTVPATSRWQADDRGIPTGRVPVAGTELDFTSARPIGTRVMDIAFGELVRDRSGVAVVTVADPSTTRSVHLRLEAGWNAVMVFTGDTVGARARQGLAVEPMTGPANLLRSGEHLVVLEPDTHWEASWELAPDWL